MRLNSLNRHKANEVPLKKEPVAAAINPSSQVEHTASTCLGTSSNLRRNIGRSMFDRRVQPLVAAHALSPITNTPTEKANPRCQQSLQRNTQENINELARSIYQSGRYYQGTTATQAKKSRMRGMDPETKKSLSLENAEKKGFFDGWIRDDINKFKDEASKHYYFTKLKSHSPEATAIVTRPTEHLSAQHYAKLAAGDEPDQAKILRTFMPDGGYIELEPDPDSGCSDKVNHMENPAFRTDKLIPPGFILRSKKDAPTNRTANDAFLKELNKSPVRDALGITKIFTEKEAAAMLHEQQTDSETDFNDWYSDSEDESD